MTDTFLSQLSRKARKRRFKVRKKQNISIIETSICHVITDLPQFGCFVKPNFVVDH